MRSFAKASWPRVLLWGVAFLCSICLLLLPIGVVVVVVEVEAVVVETGSKASAGVRMGARGLSTDVLPRDAKLRMIVDAGAAGKNKERGAAMVLVLWLSKMFVVHLIPPAQADSQTGPSVVPSREGHRGSGRVSQEKPSRGEVAVA